MTPTIFPDEGAGAPPQTPHVNNVFKNKTDSELIILKNCPAYWVHRGHTKLSFLESSDHEL